MLSEWRCGQCRPPLAASRGFPPPKPWRHHTTPICARQGSPNPAAGSVTPHSPALLSEPARERAAQVPVEGGAARPPLCFGGSLTRNRRRNPAGRLTMPAPVSRRRRRCSGSRRESLRLGSGICGLWIPVGPSVMAKAVQLVQVLRYGSIKIPTLAFPF